MFFGLNKKKATRRRSVFRVAFFIGGVFFLFFVAYKLFFFLDAKKEEQLVERDEDIIRLPHNDIEKLEAGDFILRRGYGYFSNYIARSFNSTPYDVTHVGIIVKEDSVLSVVHVLSSDVNPIDGIQKSGLGDFLKTSYPHKLVITRLKNQPKEVREQIALKALAYNELIIPFDHAGDYENPDKMYCTELVWRILEKDLKLVRIPQKKEERDLHFYSMKPMYDTVYFDFVVNQFQ